MHREGCGGCPSRLVVLVHCLEPVISTRAEFLLFFRSSSLYKTGLSRHKKSQQHSEVPGKASCPHQLWGCAHCSCTQDFYLLTGAAQPLPVAPLRANATFPADRDDSQPLSRNTVCSWRTRARTEKQGRRAVV